MVLPIGREPEFGNVGRSLHLRDERRRRILHLAHESAGLPHHLRQAIRAEQQESQDRNNQNIGNGKHTLRGRLCRQGSPAHPCKHRGPPVKIIYTRGNRTETLASLATLRKILPVRCSSSLLEVSSRSNRGHEFFSAKNVFIVGAIEITNYDHLRILIFDARQQTHSIEIVNPQTMRIYDEPPGRSFAVSFICESENDVETRCYIRDEGGDEQSSQRRRRSKKLRSATLRVSRRDYGRRTPSPN